MLDRPRLLHDVSVDGVGEIVGVQQEHGWDEENVENSPEKTVLSRSEDSPLAVKTDCYGDQPPSQEQAFEL